MPGYFENSRKLIRFMLRRERVMSAAWLALFVFFAALIPPMLRDMFGSEADLLAMVGLMQNPAMIAMMGPVYGAERYTVGAMYSNEMLLILAVLAAIMNIFLVVRHTRGDEEKGRVEVVRSLPVGRLSGLNAAMVVAVAVNAANGLLTGLIMSALGIQSMGFAGSMLFGAVLCVTGLFFAAVTALFAQIFSSARGATGASFVFLAVCYLLRAMGDMGNETLSLISPLGLVQRAQVYVENRWWPVLIVLLMTVIVAAVAYLLSAMRDMDQGFIPARPGRQSASAMLRSPFGLALRLLRNPLIAWAIGMFAFGAAYGSIMGDIETFIASNQILQQMIPASPDYAAAELFTTMLNAILAMTCAIPALIAVFKLRGEEKAVHAEPVLAGVVSRAKYLAGYVCIAVAATFLMLFTAMLGLWCASAAVMEVPIRFGSLFRAMMVYLPALWVMLGVAVLLIGALPRATGLSWAYLGFSFFAVYLGRLINIPEWLKNLTPYAYIPELPVDTIRYGTLAALTGIAAILIAGGVFAYQRRDTQA